MKALIKGWKWTLTGLGLLILVGCNEPSPLPQAPEGEFTYGTSGNQAAGDIVELSNGEGMLIVGGSQVEEGADYDLMITKVALDGKEDWTVYQGVADRDEVGWRVLRNRAGDYVILGTSSPKSGGASLLQVTFLSSDFSVTNQVSSSIAVANSGLILHGAAFYEMDGGGYFLGFSGTDYPVEVRLDAGGTVISSEQRSDYWTRETKRASQFCKRPDGGYILVSLLSPGYVDGTGIMKMDAAGNPESSTVLYLLNGLYRVYGVAPRASGGYVVSGYSEFGHGILLVDSACTGGFGVDRDDEDWLGPVMELPSGNLLFAGHDHYTEMYGRSTPDNIRVQLCDSAGGDLRSAAYGGRAMESFSAMCPLADGRVAIVGETTSYGAGGSDLYLVFFEE